MGAPGLPDRPEPAAHPDHRVGDAEREAVVEALKVHFAAGRLSLEELEERTGRALAARTAGELVPLTRDLPPAPAAPPPRDEDAWDRAYALHVRIAVLLAAVAVLLWVVSLGALSPVWALVAIAASVLAHRAVRGWRAAGGHR